MQDRTSAVLHPQAWNTRRAYVLSASLAAFLVTFAFLAWSARAAAPGDAYADAVNDTKPVVTQPDNAVGAPNETNAHLVGVGASITLDMGEGEEGTKALKAYFGAVNAQVNIKAEFLAANKAIIVSVDRQIGASVSPTTQTFDYDSANFGGQVYRFVRISVLVGAGVNIDAVEALGFVTPATNTNTTSNTNTGANTNTGGANTNTGDGTGTNTNAAANTNDTNTSTAPKDSDSDGLPDDWETQHGLNPNSAADANADPDGDHLTNAGEYIFGGDPNKADDLTKLICKGHYSWFWLLLALILGGVIGMASKVSSQKSSSTTTTTKK
jgi:hypothetical protein